LSNFGETDWERVLNDSLNAYLHSYHRAIGCSSYEIVNGEMFFEIDLENDVNRRKKDKKYFTEKAIICKES
jgi:hypothetical protein